MIVLNNYCYTVNATHKNVLHVWHSVRFQKRYNNFYDHVIDFYKYSFSVKAAWTNR